MTRKSRWFLYLVVFALFTYSALATVYLGGSGNCSTFLFDSAILTSNIGTCNNLDGIIISRSNITLDCRGYSILGTNAGGKIGVGTLEGYPFSNITITNCTISGFGTGIQITDTNKTQIIYTNVTNALNYGIYFDGSLGPSDSLYAFNQITVRNSGTGIYVKTGTDSEYLGNVNGLLIDLINNTNALYATNQVGSNTFLYLDVINNTNGVYFSNTVAGLAASTFSGNLNYHLLAHTTRSGSDFVLNVFGPGSYVNLTARSGAHVYGTFFFNLFNATTLIFGNPADPDVAIGNRIYNNAFYGTLPLDYGNNYWQGPSVPNCSTTNIMGGRCIGGNYYEAYSGRDVNDSGFLNGSYTVIGATNPDYYPLAKVYPYYKPTDSFTGALKTYASINGVPVVWNNMTNNSKHSTPQSIIYANSSRLFYDLRATFNQTLDASKLKISVNSSALAINVSGVTGINTTHNIYFPYQAGKSLCVCPSAQSLSQVSIACPGVVFFSTSEMTGSTFKSGMNVSVYNVTSSFSNNLSSYGITIPVGTQYFIVGNASGTGVSLYDGTTTLSISDNGPVAQGATAYFYANYSDSTGSPLTSATCNLSVNGSSYLMTYSGIYKQFYATKVFSDPDAYIYTINCSYSSYDPKSGSDAISITAIAPNLILSSTSPKNQTSQLYFYANYSNYAGTPLSDGSCNITLNEGTFPLVYNSTLLKFQYNRSFSTPGIFNWNVTCFKASYGTSTNTSTFNITSLPNSLSITNNGPKNQTQSITFYANYSDNFTAPITGATCNLSLYDNTSYIMGYSSGRYNYSKTFNTPGIYNWNVTCNKTYYDTKFASSTFNVTSLTPSLTISSNGTISERQDIVLRANYSDYAGQPLTTAICNYNYSGPANSSGTLVYNPSLGIYNATLINMSKVGNYSWSVSCAQTYYTPLSNSSTFQVNALPPSLSLSDQTGRIQGESVGFTASYKNNFSEHIPGANCTIRYHDGTSATMTDTGSIYYTTRNYTLPGTYAWNVTCSKTYYTTLTGTDSVTVNSGCGVITTNFNLTNNIDTNSTCLTIGASNIVLDGKGYSISTGGSYAIDGIVDNGNYQNVIIKNFNLRNFRYEVYLTDGLNYSIYYNNLTSTYSSNPRGIYLSNINQSNISNNLLNLSSTSGRGVYPYYSSYNLISNNNFGGTYETGIYFLGTTFTNVSNNNLLISGIGLTLSTNSNNLRLISNDITTSGSSKYGIHIRSSTSNVIEGNKVNATGTSAYSLYHQYGSHNISSNNFTSTNYYAGGIEASGNLFNANRFISSNWYGVSVSGTNNIFNEGVMSGLYSLNLFSTANNNNFTNASFISTSLDIFSSSNAGNSNYFINCSLDKSKIYTNSDGKAHLLWYVDTLVQDLSSTALNGVNVSFYNYTSNALTYNALTNSTGQLPRQTLTEYYQYGTSQTQVYQSPYTVNASLTNYLLSSTSQTINQSKTVTIQLTPICGYINIDTTLTQNNYSVSGSCFVINASHITFDGGGSIFTGNGMGVGISAASGITNVTIRNINMVDFQHGVNFNGSNSRLETLNLSTTSANSPTHSLFFGGTASGNNVTNSVLNSLDEEDVYSSASGSNYLINSSFDKSDIGVASGIVYAKWYLTVQTNSGGGALPAALINVTEYTSSTTDSQTGDGSGRYTFTSTEFYQNSGGKTYETPHTVNVSKDGYLSNGTTVTLTQTNSTTVTLNLEIIPLTINGDCRDLNETGIVLSGGTTYTNESICLRVTASNIVVDGNGSTIVGNGTSAQYGLFSSGYSNVTIYNLNIINFSQAQVMLTSSQDFKIYDFNVTSLNAGSSKGFSLSSSNNNNISSNRVFGFNDSSVYISNGQNNLFSSNIVNVTNSKALYLYQSDFNNFTNNLFQTTQNNAWGTYLYYSDSNYFRNNTVTTAGDSSYPLYSKNSNYDLWENNSLFSSGDYSFVYLDTSAYQNYTGNIFNLTDSMGLVFSSSSNNLFSRNVISSWSYNFDLTYNTNNNYIIDNSLILINPALNHFYLYTSAGTKNYVINCTFNKDKIYSGSNPAGAQLYVIWYLDTLVQNTTGQGLDTTSVSIKDKNDLQTFSGQTNSTGYIVRQNVTEFIYNGSNKIIYTPHNITANKPSSIYRSNSTQVNLTQTNSTTALVVLATDIAPSVTQPQFDPSPVYTDTTIIANTTVTDAEGDLSTVNFLWYVNGANVYNQSVSGGNGETVTSSLDHNYYVKDDVLNVTVYAYDGYLNSTEESNEITVSNFPPEVQLVGFNPESYTAAEGPINYSVHYSDADDDPGTVYFQWQKNGIDFGPTISYNPIASDSSISDNLMNIGNYSKNDLVNVTIWADDGTENSANVTSPTLTIENTPPTIDTDLSTITLDSDTPWIYDYNATDIDVDQVVDTLAWNISGLDGLEINSSTGEINFTPSESQKGDYPIIVTVNDSVDPSDTDSDYLTLTINDVSPPRVNITSPTNTTYTTSSVDLNYTIEEANLNYCWYSLNEVTAYLNPCVNTTLSSLSSGEYNLTFQAYDTSGNVNETNVTFTVDLPPTLSLSLSPDPLYKSSNLTLSITPDELVNGTIYINWTNDGNFLYQSVIIEVGDTTYEEILNNTYFNKTQNITAYVYADDGISNSSMYNISIIVNNSAPFFMTSLPFLDIDIAFDPNNYTTFNWSEYLYDADNDDLNCTGNIVNVSIATINVDNVTKIANLSAIAEGSTSYSLNCTDGENSVYGSDSLVVYVSNHHPNISGFDLTDPITKMDTPSASTVFNDEDGSGVVYFNWTVNGSEVQLSSIPTSNGETVSATLSNDYFNKGDNLTVYVWATDETFNTSVENLSRLIQNTPLTQFSDLEDISLGVGESTLVTLSDYFTDIDGDDINYSITSTLGIITIDNDADIMNVTAQMLEGTEPLTLEATDGESTITSNSFNLIVGNTAPEQIQTIPDLTLNVGESTTLNLDEYFTDDQELTYSISSTSYASTSIDSETKILTVTGSSAGTDSATIEADDGLTTTTSNSFSIIVSSVAGTSSGGSGTPHYECVEDDGCEDKKSIDCFNEDIRIITSKYKCENPSSRNAKCVFKENLTQLQPCKYGCSSGTCITTPPPPKSHGSSCKSPEVLINGTCQNVTKEMVHINRLELEFDNNYYPTVYTLTSPNDPQNCLKKSFQAIKQVDKQTYDMMVEAKNSGAEFTPTYHIHDNILELIWAMGAHDGERCVEFDINAIVSPAWAKIGLNTGSTLIADRFCMNLNNKPVLITQEFEMCQYLIDQFNKQNVEVIQELTR